MTSTRISYHAGKNLYRKTIGKYRAANRTFTWATGATFSFDASDGSRVHHTLARFSFYFRRALGMSVWLSVIAVAFGLLLRRQGHRPVGSCPTCGYDLRTTPNRCPECGEDQTADNAIPYTPAARVVS